MKFTGKGINLCNYDIDVGSFLVDQEIHYLYGCQILILVIIKD
jgi:hypothetical protein